MCLAGAGEQFDLDVASSVAYAVSRCRFHYLYTTMMHADTQSCIYSQKNKMSHSSRAVTKYTFNGYLLVAFLISLNFLLCLRLQVTHYIYTLAV